MAVALVAAVGLAWCGAGVARAQSLSLEPATARAIGRAGVGVVADDTAAVWWQNPAAAARRASARIVLGVALVDPDLEIAPFTAEPAPLAVSRASSGWVPMLAASWSHGDTTLGISYFSAQRIARRFEGAIGGVSTEVGTRVFALRHAGLSAVLRRDTATIGAAHRLTDGLAVGASLGLGRVGLSESRRLWAGIEGRDEVGSPLQDLDLTCSGSSWRVPSASAGVVLVPQDGAIELAGAVSAVAPTTLRGAVDGRPVDENGPKLAGPGRGELALPLTLVVRTGVRWQGERWSAEGNGELELVSKRSRELRWQLDDVVVTDRSSLTATPTQLPSQLSLRSLASLRGAVDVEVVEGLLWLTGGGAWSPISTSSMRVAPGLADLGGRTAAFGAEISAGGVTISMGISRAWSRSLSVTRSLRRLDNPFEAGDQFTGFGNYRAVVDQVGISVEVEAR